MSKKTNITQNNSVEVICGKQNINNAFEKTSTFNEIIASQKDLKSNLHNKKEDDIVPIIITPQYQDNIKKLQFNNSTAQQINNIIVANNSDEAYVAILNLLKDFAQNKNYNNTIHTQQYNTHNKNSKYEEGFQIFIECNNNIQTVYIITYNNEIYKLLKEKKHNISREINNIPGLEESRVEISIENKDDKSYDKKLTSHTQKQIANNSIVDVRI